MKSLVWIFTKNSSDFHRISNLKHFNAENVHKAEEVNENCLELRWIDRRWIVAINVLLYWIRYIHIYAKRPFNFNRSAFVSFQLLYETIQSKLQLQTSKSFFSYSIDGTFALEDDRIAVHISCMQIDGFICCWLFRMTCKFPFQLFSIYELLLQQRQRFHF